MVDDNIFIDTNILVYSHDSNAGERHQKARSIVDGIWLTGARPFISAQVIREFFNALVVKQKVDPRLVEEHVNILLEWKFIPETEEIIRQAIFNRNRYQVSFWDAIILSSAQVSGASELWTEDLNPGQNYGGVIVVNPLL